MRSRQTRCDRHGDFVAAAPGKGPRRVVEPSDRGTGGLPGGAVELVQQQCPSVRDRGRAGNAREPIDSVERGGKPVNLDAGESWFGERFHVVFLRHVEGDRPVAISALDLGDRSRHGNFGR